MILVGAEGVVEGVARPKTSSSASVRLSGVEGVLEGVAGPKKSRKVRFFGV